MWIPARILWLLPALFVLPAGCGPEEVDADAGRKQLAIEFLRGVYTGDVSVVDEIAAPDIVISYPIFSEIFDTPALEGRDAVRRFVTGFGERWIDGKVTVHRAVADGDVVILVWEFEARSAMTAAGGETNAWGGITVYRFNALNQVELEIGEESTPGPLGRVPGAFAKP